MSRHAAHQLPLFSEEEWTAVPQAPNAAIAGITWSHSRRSTLEQCPRKYYYEYYGAAKRTALAEPHKDEIRWLKDLQNRHERAGSILHLVIATSLRQARAGNTWDPARLESWGRQLLRADRLYSRVNPDGGNLPDVKYPPVLLREYHYRERHADALLAEAEERLAGALRSFATSERYRTFRGAGASAGALVEHHFTLHGLPCRVEGVIDLAFDDGQGVTVVDWKSGAGDGTGDDSLQLAAYALWAAECFDYSPASIRVCKVYLATGDIAYFDVTDTVLAAARTRIVQDAERMVAVQDYGAAAMADAFTPCAYPAVCALCPFARVCPVGASRKDIPYA
jgi:hypothetical protein